jgi:pimeloyl-ACP methyl ester carboxylesterase
MASAVQQPMPEVEGVEHRFMPVRDFTAHVAVAGPEDGPPVLLQHGWPQHWWMWRRQIQALAAAGYRVYAPDMRGFGWSEAKGKTKDYVCKNLVTDTLDLLDQLGIKEPIRLAGHDWGAWNGFLIAMRAPERFDRFFALNIAPPWGDPGPFDLAENLKTLWKLNYQVPISTPLLGRWLLAGGAGDFFVKQASHSFRNQAPIEDGSFQFFVDQFKDPARGQASTYMYRSFLTRELIPVAIGSYTEGRLTVPTRVLFGTEDVAISPTIWEADHSKMADDLSAELVENCGHFIVDEQPELVTDRMLAFFGEAL